MKKLSLLILILLLSACSIENNENHEVQKENDNIETTVTEESQEEIYIDNNEVKLSLFLYDGNYWNKNRIEDTYYTDFINGTDIGSFEVFLTDDEAVNGSSFKNTWFNYYNNYENIESHKIGFNLKFVLKDGTHYSANYFEPDTYKFGEYFYTYLYDDVNQADGAYYSHLEEINEETLLTSIKIYAVDGIDKVDSFILSAFTYDTEDDFDDDGNYRGNSIYVIRIKRK